MNFLEGYNASKTINKTKQNKNPPWQMIFSTKRMIKT